MKKPESVKTDPGYFLFNPDMSVSDPGEMHLILNGVENEVII